MQQQGVIRIRYYIYRVIQEARSFFFLEGGSINRDKKKYMITCLIEGGMNL